MALRLRVGTHHRITIVEHDTDNDRGRLVAVVAIAEPRYSGEPARLAAEIVDAVNAARDRDGR